MRRAMTTVPAPAAVTTIPDHERSSALASRPTGRAVAWTVRGRAAVPVPSRARGALIGALLALLLAASFIAPAQPVAAWVSSQFNGAQEALLFSLTNEARVAAGVPPLRFDDELRAVARWRSQDMAERGYFSHQIPPDGKSVFEFMDARGIRYRSAGENIGWNNGPDDEATRLIHERFMASDAHRANLMSPGWDSVGIGAFKGSDGRIRYTVVFVQSIRASVSAAYGLPPAGLPVTLRISGGYRTRPTTGYGTAVSVPNGMYATFSVTLQPAAANAPVRFYQRIGKTGAWTFLSTGRADASGTVVWSKVVRVPAAAIGYGRYVYFKVMVPATDGSASWSNAVRAVARSGPAG